ncbi:type I-E CRISPR-associated protein Cas6/Cse3/CasE [Bifidobacterium rousetti]|uniref:type I-E CRISPR-associated protein Cas6/Cse3/CasE n=1 Tax=Bifidobacterium rousetti TaxID=2045439 RepID=UPI0015E63591|nr:type I-E CRISPR-associated protein Cas6/Cse3/CasE [Bifidobacterium rousetti]
MKLARITLDLNDPRNTHATASRQRLHAIIAAATGEGRQLWRLEHNRIYLAANTIDNTQLQTRFGRCTIETTDYDNLLNTLQTGQHYRWAIQANPTTTKSHDPHKNRIPLKTNPERLAWIHRQITKAGCTPITTTITTAHAERFKRGTDTITIQNVSYHGELEINNPDQLRQALTQGLGPGKGYGLGMLLLN